jgi:hypothetical protein
MFDRWTPAGKLFLPFLCYFLIVFSYNFPHAHFKSGVEAFMHFSNHPPGIKSPSKAFQSRKIAIPSRKHFKYQAKT